MARIRTIKPELFLHEELAELPIYARMLFIGLFTQADRRGRLEDRPKRLKAVLFPYDDVDIDNLLNSLHSAGVIVRYVADGLKLIQVTNFEKHQRFTGDEAKLESKYPAYHRVIDEEAGKKQERNTQETLEKPGKERKGKEKEKEINHQQQQAGACAQLEVIFVEKQERLKELFPDINLNVALEKFLNRCRGKPCLLDPYEATIKWLQTEFKPVKGEAYGTGNSCRTRAVAGKAPGIIPPNGPEADWLDGSTFTTQGASAG